ncbi:hypothetical protein CYMTET_5882 [Cymbomonas tetramitiformis]|uniref:Right handed beta helix domain-containing protein n=1 Tax=Cymbomonas tetramitiformis TaxID=36881 RepID=A0AAE0GY71_9CHLO|nr:hypothetical protein CYMTET_5882 [Cymbomonas tetramitiformis]
MVGNTGETNGGGVIVTESTIDINRTILRKNIANGHGGGMSLAYGNQLKVSSSRLRDNRALVMGGGLMAEAGNSLLVISSNVTGNLVTGNGGGVSCFGWSSLELWGTEVSGNSAEMEGGGLYLVSSGDLQLVRSTVQANHVGQRGGGIYIQTGGLNASASQIRGNKAMVKGGGVYAWGGKLVIGARTHIAANLAGEDGGGIYLYGLTSQNALSSGGASLAVSGNTQIVENVAQAHDGGGIHAGTGTTVTITSNVTIRNNLAGVYGGGAFLKANSTVIYDSRVIECISLYDGGALAVIAGTLEMRRVVIEANLAGISGGGLFLQAARVLLGVAGGAEGNEEGVVLAHNSAAFIGGAITATEFSSLEIVGCHLEGNAAVDAAGGLYISNSAALIRATSCGANRAHNGGCLILDTSTVEMEGCVIDGNAALVGGGVYSQESNVSMHNISVQNNAAYLSSNGSEATTLEGYGGGIWHTSVYSNLSVHNSTLEGNSANEGGGLFLEVPCGECSISNLSILQFRNNRVVENGPNIFWTYQIPTSTSDAVASTPVRCLECAFDDSVAIASVVLRVFMTQGGAEVSCVTAKSSEVVTPELTYTVIDHPGNVLQFSSGKDVTAIADAASDGSFTGLSGVRTVPYTGVARFSELVVHGRPESTVRVNFISSQGGTYDTAINVTLLACEDGEVYDSEMQSCNKCKAGSVKWDNSSVPCESCDEVSGLTCHGGNEFSIDDGYWMAFQSAATHCAANATQCILDRVHSCLDAFSCKPNQTAVYAGMSTWHDRESAQCSSGHSSAVLCGECLENHHRTNQGKCKDCGPNAAWHVFRFLSTVAALCLLVYLVWKAYQRIDHVHHQQFFRTAKHVSTPQAAVSIFLGYMQVSSQWFVVFGSEIPEPYKSFLHGLSTFSLTPETWLGMSCLIYATSRGSLSAGFYASFAFSLLVPGVIFLRIFAGWAAFTSQHISRGVPLLTVLRLDWLLPTLIASHQAQPAAGAAGGASGDAADGDGDAHDKTDKGVMISWEAQPSEARSAEQPIVYSFNPLAEEPRERTASDAPQLAPGMTFGKERTESVVEMTSQTACGSEDSPRALHGGSLLAEPSKCGSAQLEAAARSSLVWHGFSDNAEENGVVHGEGSEGTIFTNGSMPGPGGEWSHAHGEEGRTCHNDEIRDGDEKVPAQTDMAPSPDKNKSSWPLVLFLLVLLHTSCSTTMFQLFHCVRVYSDGAEPTAWIHSDLSVACFTVRWWGFAVVAIQVICVYVIGLPLGLWRAMVVLRDLKKFRLSNGRVVYLRRRQFRDDGVGGDCNSQGNMHLVYETCDDEGAGMLLEATPCWRGDDIDRLPTASSHRCSSELNTGGPREDWDWDAGMLNALDDPVTRSFLGVFYQSLRLEFCWYGSYEMLRRMAQVSFVILVQVAVPSSNFDVTYANIVAISSLFAAAYTHPYRNNIDTRLQCAVLYNCCMEQLFFMMTRLRDDGESDKVTQLIGAVILITCQMLLAAVIVGCVWIKYGDVRLKCLHFMKLKFGSWCRDASATTSKEENSHILENSSEEKRSRI